MLGTPEGSTKSGFIKKPAGMEPTTPALQDIGLSPTSQPLLKDVWLSWV